MNPFRPPELHLPKLKLPKRLKLKRRRDRLTVLPLELIIAILRQPSLEPHDLVSFALTSRTSYAAVLRYRPLILNARERQLYLAYQFERLAILTYSYRAALLTQVYPKMFDDILQTLQDLYGPTDLLRDDWPDWECAFSLPGFTPHERWSCARLVRDLLETFHSWITYREFELWETEQGKLEYLDREPPRNRERERVTKRKAIMRKLLRKKVDRDDGGRMASVTLRWRRGTGDYNMVMVKKFEDGGSKEWVLGETLEMRRARINSRGSWASRRILTFGDGG